MEDSLLQVVNSGIIRKCTLLLIVLALPSLIAKEIKQCIPGVTYLDPVTGHCDPCSDICEFPREQGTVARCETLCHGYKARGTPSLTCSAYQYYDAHVDRCEPCQSICLHPGSEDDCHAHCPDWTNPTISSSTSRTDVQSNTISRNASVMAALEDDVGGEDAGNTMSTWVYAAVIGVGALLVCGLAVLATVLWKPCAKKIKGISHTRRCGKRPFQEQGHPMLQTHPIVRSGRGPFGSPTEDIV